MDVVVVLERALALACLLLLALLPLFPVPLLDLQPLLLELLRVRLHAQPRQTVVRVRRLHVLVVLLFFRFRDGHGCGDGAKAGGERRCARTRLALANVFPDTDLDALLGQANGELELLGPTLRAVVALGAIGWDATLRTLGEQGWAAPRPRPRFTHGAEVTLVRPDGATLTLLGCFHVSQQNTFTGRLTPAMLDAVLARAKQVTAKR